MEGGSPMSFKLPVKVISKYKDKLPKKSSFKRSLTEEIKKMCGFMCNLEDQTEIIKRVEKLEKESNINKRYVVTEVDSSSGKILKDFRSKYDITQSALLWLWLDSEGEIYNENEMTERIQQEPIVEEVVETVQEKKIEEKPRLTPVTKVERGYIDLDEGQEDNVKFVETNLSNTSVSNLKKIEKLMKMSEYEGPTKELIVELPESIIDNFQSNLSNGTSLNNAIQEEIRKLCKVVRYSKAITTIVNHVKRIGKYKTEKKSISVKIDPESLEVLNLFNNNYGISKSDLIWLWLSMDNLKFNVFKLVD